MPPFNPDLGDRSPATVIRFRAQLQTCDAILISSLEYAHGVPGVLKNALDWVVGSGELVDKPIAVINASGRATHGWTSLRDTLTVMSARVIVSASITVPLDGRTLDSKGIVGDATLSAAVRSAIDALVLAAPDAGRSSGRACTVPLRIRSPHTWTVVSPISIGRCRFLQTPSMSIRQRLLLPPYECRTGLVRELRVVA